MKRACPTIVVILITSITLQLQLMLASRLESLEMSSAIGFANSLSLCLVVNNIEYHDSWIW